jgi:hypothetical protein
MTNFWKEWIEADELDRVKIVKTLPPFRRGGLAHYVTAALMNSYLVDLYNHTKKEAPKEPVKKPEAKKK